MQIRVVKNHDKNLTERNHLFYLANLGSEMLRVFSALEKGDIELKRSSIDRCNNLIDKIIKSDNLIDKNHEVFILKQILDSLLIDESKEFFITKKEINNYFNPFALRLSII